MPTKNITPSVDDLVEMVQYLTKTNHNLADSIQKLEKEVKQLRKLIRDQHATLQLHGLADYGN